MEGWSAELRLAVAAARAAGDVALASFGRAMDVTFKSPDQPLTAADLEANAVLYERLVGARPEYGWLSEETADDPRRLTRRRVWVVDPIDGTRSFIAGRPEFAISVGLAEDGEAVLGVVHNPASGELYWAVRGEGAWKAVVEGAPERGVERGAGAAPGDARPEAGDARRDAEGGALPPAHRVHVRTGSTADQRVLLASRSELSRGEFDPFAGGWRFTPLGSTAYKLAKLAEGAADAFLSRGPKSEWDVCAGGLLVEEAGGTATDLRGEPLRYNHPDPSVYGILATNGEMHRYLLGVVETLPPPPRLAYGPAATTEPTLEEDDE
ncbi:MAG TPA: 3'(2'),5'-bisphosphate nucleotidase CysQ [Longimicrobiales bacterium]|nr:3'(2'),5'-bisphosphate nucleotidase CysQ [Longimicrobiales bacterium]